MPRLVYNDYFFYKIVCLTDDVDLSYVGSTCNWRNRKYQHKFDCTNPNSKSYNNKKYQMMRSNGGWENFKMIEIGFRENLTLRQAEAIEEDYRVELRANMNTNKCSIGLQTMQEYLANYKQVNRQQISEYNANYYRENRQQASEYQVNYKQENREHLNAKHTCKICGGKFITNHKSRHLKTNKHKKALNDAASSSSAED
jgi:hypothetical protein